MTRLAYSPAIGYASVDSDGSVIKFLEGPCCRKGQCIAYGTDHECQSADDDSHDVRHAPTVTRPYQARTVHYLGRMVYVSNAGTSVIRTYTLQGSYGTSPGRVVCQSYRSR